MTTDEFENHVIMGKVDSDGTVESEMFESFIRSKDHFSLYGITHNTVLWTFLGSDIANSIRSTALLTREVETAIIEHIRNKYKLNVDENGCLINEED